MAVPPTVPRGSGGVDSLDLAGSLNLGCNLLRMRMSYLTKLKSDKSDSDVAGSDQLILRLVLGPAQATVCYQFVASQWTLDTLTTTELLTSLPSLIDSLTREGPMTNPSLLYL